MGKIEFFAIGLGIQLIGYAGRWLPIQVAGGIVCSLVIGAWYHDNVLHRKERPKTANKNYKSEWKGD